MGMLRDLIEVYGALDKAVGRSNDPAVANAVDSFVPGFSANCGWYDEIERFFFGKNAKSNPDLGEACSRIGAASKVADIERAASQSTGDGENGPRRPRPALTKPQKSRLLYGLTAAARAHQAAAPKMTYMPDDYLMYAYMEALAALGPDDEPYDSRLGKAGAKFEDIWNEVDARCAGRGHFSRLRKYAAITAGVVDPSTQDIPLCSAKVVTIDGLPVVVVDTNLHSDSRSFHDVVEIVNPFNWNENYPEFFLSMDPCDPPERTDGWFRVLETVGFPGLGGLQLTTNLKYYPKLKLDEGIAHIDYDLDDPPPGQGDGKVTVDRGFINIEVANDERDPTKPGVSAKTRKVVHIEGLSPYAQQRLVCLTGYGTASSEFLLGGKADAEKPYPRDFVYYKDKVPQADPEVEPTEVSTHAVATAVNLWTESVQGLVSDYFDFAEKWMDGRLRIRDVADYSSQVTERLVSGPLEFWDRVNQPRRGQSGQAQPRGGRGGNPEYGGDT
ncbi:MAG: hypothetical protein QOC76_2327 [Mycobacterium sp.]|jgi:hypothetical protein|nr:hypothetical protein [Mycobacterium sp.]